jgi:hypothetical protein
MGNAVKERVGVIVSLLEDAGMGLLDSETFGMALVCLVFLLAGILLGADLIR